MYVSIDGINYDVYPAPIVCTLPLFLFFQPSSFLFSLFTFPGISSLAPFPPSYLLGGLSVHCKWAHFSWKRNPRDLCIHWWRSLGSMECYQSQPRVSFSVIHSYASPTPPPHFVLLLFFQRASKYRNHMKFHFFSSFTPYLSFFGFFGCYFTWTNHRCQWVDYLEGPDNSINGLAIYDNSCHGFRTTDLGTFKYTKSGVKEKKF